MSYYKKLLATNILVSTLYILIFSIIIAVFLSVSYKRMYEKNLNESMMNITKRVDNAVANATVVANVISNNESVKKYVDEEYPDYSNRSRVSDFFYDDVGMLLNYGAHAAVTKYVDDHIMTSNYSSSFQYYCSVRGITEEQIEVLFENFRTQNIYNISYLFSRAGKINYMVIVIRRTLPGSMKPYYIFVSYPLDTLFDAGQYKGVIVPAISINKKVVYVGENDISSMIKSYVNNPSESKYNITSYTSNIVNSTSGMVYHFFVKKHNYIDNPIGISLLIILLFLVLIASSIYLMYRITNRVYSPVNNLIESIPSDIGSRKSIDNEFSFIISAFNKLDSDNKESSSIINQFRLSAKDKFISDLLFGTLDTMHISQNIAEYKLPKVESSLVAVIIEYSNFESLSRTLSRSGIFTLKTTVSSRLYSIFSGEDMCILTETSQDNHVMIISCPDEKELKTHLQNALLRIMDEMDIELCASIGKSVDTYAEVCDSYSVALDIVRRNTFTLDRNVVETEQDINESMRRHIIYLPETESDLITAVSACKYQKVYLLLQDILKKNSSVSGDNISQLIIMMYSTIQKILYNFDFTEKEVFGDDTSVYLELKLAQNIATLKSTLTQHLNKIMSYIENANNDKNTERSDRMIRFIEQNYAEDVSLIDLAEYMNMSQEYTSRIFKQEIGENYKEYLMKYRYTKAKEILEKSPNMKMKDVATAVGCNTKTLSRLMNKYD